MDARTFLGLHPTHNRFRWSMSVAPRISNFGGNLFGGAGLAAAIVALEAVTDRPVVWASAQYLSYALTGSIVDLDVKLAIQGHNTTQARVTAHVADAEVLTVNAALGTRPTRGEGTFAQRPIVPPPQDGPARSLRMPAGGTINAHIEMRIADGRDWPELDGTPRADGRSAMWARVTGMTEVSAASLAILGDWVPFALGQALGRPAGGNSLDNTIRIIQPVATDWVLLDLRVQAVRNGFGHGLVHQWAQDGTLMATASQSVILRYRDVVSGSGTA